MGVLGAVAVVAALAGCYAPAVRDCTVSCAAPSDCASGQVCGDDGLCAAPALAGRCAGAPDAGPLVDAAHDAPPRDAAMPDAPETVSLHVQVMGMGSVAVDGYGTCSSLDPQKGNCTYELVPGVVQRVRAVQIDANQLFAGWTSMTCSGAGPICTFVPAIATSVTAKFSHHGVTL
jgi:hypothetical protein